MEEKVRKQPLSTGVPAAKNATGVRVSSGQKPGMAGRNTGGPVVNFAERRGFWTQ